MEKPHDSAWTPLRRRVAGALGSVPREQQLWNASDGVVEMYMIRAAEAVHAHGHRGVDDASLIRTGMQHAECSISLDKTFDGQHQEETNDAFKCPRCRNADVTVQFVQERSMDEPSSIYVHCKACGRRTRVH